MRFELNFFKNQLNASGEKLRKNTILSMIYGLLFLLILSYVLYIPPLNSIEDPGLSVGDIVPNDIIIKKDLTIIDEEKTERNKQSALEEVIPVYQFLPLYKENRTELINNWMEFLRNSRKQFLKNRNSLSEIKSAIEEKFGITLTDDSIVYMLRSNIFSRIDLDAFFPFLEKTDRPGIISSKAGTRKSKDGSIKIVSKSGIGRYHKVSDLIDLNELENRIANHLKTDQNFTSKESEFLTSILIEFTNVNLTFSSNLTEKEKSGILSRIDPVVIKLKKGRVILRKGDEIKNEDLKTIKLIQEEERESGGKLSVFFLIFFLMGPVLFFVVKLFAIWESKFKNEKRVIPVFMVTLLLSAVIYRILIFILPLVLKDISSGINFGNNLFLYSIPFTFGALIIAFIFNIHSAVIFSFINALTGSILGGWDLNVFLYVLIGSLTVSFGIEHYQRLKRSPVLKVSLLWLFPVNLLVLILFNFTAGTPETFQILLLTGISAFSAISAPVLASFIIPLWEIVFNLLTELKLVELTNLNLPVFREMLEKAPGTYHHSQMVSSLSESAAYDLNLSPLLLNAMALYHDIGKIDNPQIFTENHAIYENPHKNLTPKESAKIIISHINNGLERAEELKLSDKISSAINQHHGTKLVRFFYEKAVENAAGNLEEVDRNLFRYPGVKPKNIENAIIMIADQVEAASKSLSSPSEDEIRNVIQRIIDSDIEEKQFDECEGLTFRSLNIIANAFLKKLSSIYHMRISYPGFDFKKDTNNGNGH